MKFTIKVDQQQCIGCSVCKFNAPEIFDIDTSCGKSFVKEDADLSDIEKAKMIADMCPVTAIHIYDENGVKIYPPEK